MQQVTLGKPESFERLPAEVTVEGREYYLTRHEGAYVLLSRRCPHAGYTVEVEGGELFCPLHGWTFDMESGQCLNVKSAALASYKVAVCDGVLVAELEER
ncbi:Rieske (2Fe-2S) protein [Paenibacillus sambharensis]|uniref:Rieske (2Fe-2S) protein n=1 Tax=Paenibacillus sambharensis TaxID=1803190 RepID=A0A2W1LN02_9BACL|nr:Rieske (2Fe-2S) protein [Paenibacillus sambharensis]PZD95824.1 Rieske (2Fe-2S) protein [Paenibacillus sambharensis]